MNLLGTLKYFECLLKSKKTDKKIIVIESDDWGSERIPDLKTRSELKKSGIDVESNPHMKYDTLERFDDLELLQNILDYFNNTYGKKIKITANFIVANPDFQNILNNGFQQYFFEDFVETYKKRDGSDIVWNKIQQLIAKDYMVPQFHGREHINVQYWLKELQTGNTQFLNAFFLGCYAIDAPGALNNKNNLMAAFEYSDTFQKSFVLESISEGLKIFEKYFKRKSETIVAPRHTWETEIELFIKNCGISTIQSTMFQLITSLQGYKKKFLYTGMKNPDSGIKYLVRNAFFEPSYSDNIDWVNKTLKKINLAFRFHVPAIIGMHRLNFVGGLDPKRRDQNFLKFKYLIERIIGCYPDVEFVSSEELSKMI